MIKEFSPIAHITDKDLALINTREVELASNQFDENGIYLDPYTELKTFTYTLNEEDFITFFLTYLGLRLREIAFLKVILKNVDKYGCFYTKQMYPIFYELKYTPRSVITRMNEISRYSIAGIPIVRRIDTGYWQVPRELLFRMNDLKNSEFRIYYQVKP
jgi:hypothetical protein